MANVENEAYTRAATMLHSAIVSAITIVENGGDPRKAINALKPYASNFDKAAYRQTDGKDNDG